MSQSNETQREHKDSPGFVDWLWKRSDSLPSCMMTPELFFRVRRNQCTKKEAAEVSRALAHSNSTLSQWMERVEAWIFEQFHLKKFLAANFIRDRANAELQHVWPSIISFVENQEAKGIFTTNEATDILSPIKSWDANHKANAADSENIWQVLEKMIELHPDLIRQDKDRGARDMRHNIPRTR